jgi:hypothetical protein
LQNKLNARPGFARIARIEKSVKIFSGGDPKNVRLYALPIKAFTNGGRSRFYVSKIERQEIKYGTTSILRRASAGHAGLSAILGGRAARQIAAAVNGRPDGNDR